MGRRRGRGLKGEGGGADEGQGQAAAANSFLTRNSPFALVSSGIDGRGKQRSARLRRANSPGLRRHRKSPRSPCRTGATAGRPAAATGRACRSRSRSPPGARRRSGRQAPPGSNRVPPAGPATDSSSARPRPVSGTRLSQSSRICQDCLTLCNERLTKRLRSGRVRFLDPSCPMGQSGRDILLQLRRQIWWGRSRSRSSR